MKFTRFLCAAALATVITGSLAAGAANAAGSGANSAQPPAACETRPGDTEWTNPATHCPPVL
ncbi:hypothetical protein [Streptomyces sp. NPDC012888]|uniref:hypothetical protein n=1 Tax=Streptomyces sp. NPDC012888 TaxID=3364855 RepID=UPI003691054E